MPQPRHPRAGTTQPNRLADDVRGGGSPCCTFRSAVFRRVSAASWLATALTTVPTNRPCGPNACLDGNVVIKLSRLDQGRPAPASRDSDGRPEQPFCICPGGLRRALDLAGRSGRPRASGEQIWTVGSDPGTWETSWPEVCWGWFVCTGTRRQRQNFAPPPPRSRSPVPHAGTSGAVWAVLAAHRQFGRPVTGNARPLGRSQFLIVMVTPELEAVPAGLVATDVKV